MSRNLSNALTGWIAGLTATVALGFTWPIIFPAIINVENYYGDGPGLFAIIGLSALVMTPVSAIAGIMGGRVSKEGGKGSQRLIAIMFAILFTIPVDGLVLLFFTGYGFSF